MILNLSKKQPFTKSKLVIFQIIKKFPKDMITDMNIGTKMPEKVMFSIETEWISILSLLKNFFHCVD